MAEPCYGFTPKAPTPSPVQTAFVVRDTSGLYVQWNGHYKRFEWGSSDTMHSTPMTESLARDIVRQLGGFAILDPYCVKRVPYEWLGENHQDIVR